MIHVYKEKYIARALQAHLSRLKHEKLVTTSGGYRTKAQGLVTNYYRLFSHGTCSNAAHLLIAPGVMPLTAASATIYQAATCIHGCSVCYLCSCTTVRQQPRDHCFAVHHGSVSQKVGAN